MANEEKSYTVKTLSISNAAQKEFDDKYKELVKYAKKMGHRTPTQAGLASKLFLMAKTIDAEKFFQ